VLCALLPETSVCYLSYPEDITACVSNVASGYLTGSGDDDDGGTDCLESGRV